MVDVSQPTRKGVAMWICRAGLLCVLIVLSIGTASGQSVIAPARAVLQVGDGGSARAGFFYGDDGYILTVLDRVEVDNLTGTAFAVRFWKNDGAQLDDKAVIVDVLPKSGLALLRLTAAEYPHATSLVWADGFMSSRRPLRANATLQCTVSTPHTVAPFYNDQPCKLTGKGQLDGNLLLEPPVLKNQIGAPVFVEGKIVGIVGKVDSVYPISYAGRLLAMTESIPELVDRMATRKSMISTADQKHWNQFVSAVQAVELSTPIAVDIIRSPAIDGTPEIIEMKVRVDPLVTIMRDPATVEIEAYPQFRYRDPKDLKKSPIVVSWTEGFNRGVLLKKTFGEGDAPTRTQSKTEVFSSLALQGDLIKMINNPLASPEVVGFMVFMRWDVRGAENRVRSHRAQEYISLPPR